MVSATLAGLAALTAGPGFKRAAAADRPARIAFFGDSLTYGLHASAPERSYSQIVAARLRSTDDFGPVFYFLQDPYGLLDDALRRLPYLLAAAPTLVFLELGHHEIWSNRAELARFEERYTALLDPILDSGATLIPSTLAWLGATPGTFAHAASLSINSLILALAEARGLVTADIWTPTYQRAELLSTPADPSFIEPFRGDNLHPNDAGHRALADAFWQAYRRVRATPLPASVPRKEIDLGKMND